MSAEHDATPMGTPVPVGQCPHCHGFLWVTLRSKAPIALPPSSAPPPPPSGCCACPHCHAQIYVHLGRLPPIAQPAAPRQTALVPRGQTTTRRQRR
jgi:hypothetical protein